MKQQFKARVVLNPSEAEPLADLEDFLRDLPLDSSGSFSVSLHERWKKLGEQALAHPNYWLLLAIQGLILAGAHTLKLSFRSGEFWLVAEGADPSRLTPENAARVPVWETALAVVSAQNPQRLVCVAWEASGLSAADLQGNGEPLRPTLPPPNLSQPAFGLYLLHKGLTEVLMGGHLAYSLQFCPIPVLWFTPGLLGGSWKDLRVDHWLDDAPVQRGQDRARLVSVSSPVLADFYWETESGPLLLKPPGGSDGALEADWTYDPHLDWHGPPQGWQSTSSSARYLFRHPQAQPQTLEWMTRGTILNTPLASKTEGRYLRPFVSGEAILLLENHDPGDWILPIRAGVILEPIRDQLGVQGARLVVAADALKTDLSGLKLLRDEAFDQWLHSWRQRLVLALETALQNPPQSRLRERNRGLKSMGGAGALAFGYALLDGLQASDLLYLGYGGLLGGFLIYSGRELWERYAPARWKEQGRLGLVRELEKRLDQASTACSRQPQG